MTPGLTSLQVIYVFCVCTAELLFGGSKQVVRCSSSNVILLKTAGVGAHTHRTECRSSIRLQIIEHAVF
jgi:hypothetical protein